MKSILKWFCTENKLGVEVSLFNEMGRITLPDFFFLSKVKQCAINHRLSLLLNSNVLDSLCLKLPQGA